MEGDAGASRLNPNDTDSSSSSEVTAEDSASEVEAEDSAESDDGADQTSTSEDSPESPVIEGNPSRVGRRWVIALIATLLVLAGGLGAAGYFVIRANKESRAITQHAVAAVQAAKDCVAATQAPDIGAIIASQQKIIDCSTGDFRTQAMLYSSLLVEAYQAANAHVEVSDMRAAAERSNADGSVDVLVAVRVKVSNSEAKNQEAGYRLRVKMAPDEGQYRIAKLDQVAK